jgi:hypothetical protein
VEDDSYYAAQGNATRIFWHNELANELKGWRRVAVKRYSAISYIFPFQSVLITSPIIGLYVSSPLGVATSRLKIVFVIKAKLNSSSPENPNTFNTLTSSLGSYIIFVL